MGLSFSQKTEAVIEELLNRHPRWQDALVPVLYEAQEEFGFVTHEVMELVASRLDLPPEQVMSAATFHSTLMKCPVGKYHVRVCTGVSCFLRGADKVLQAFEYELGIGPGETTEDGLFTLSTVECLAYCGTAPAVQVNEVPHESVAAGGVRDLIRRLKEEQEE